MLDLPVLDEWARVGSQEQGAMAAQRDLALDVLMHAAAQPDGWLPQD